MICRFVFSAFLVLICASAFAHASGPDSKNPSSSFEDALLHAINLYRVDKGLSPLSPDTTLYTLAKSHSRYMIQKNVLSHDHFQERFNQCRRSHCVENTGWNFTTPEAQMVAWKSSAGHNANLLSTKIKNAGIAKVGSFVTFFACD